MISTDTKYEIKTTSNFRKQLKKIAKQNKNLNKLKEVIYKLANKEILDNKYLNHDLKNDRKYQDCKECHIEPDWLLIYKYKNETLVLLLFATGSHSDLFE